MSSEHLRIAVFAKEGVKLPQEPKGKVLKIEELPEHVIFEFAKITAGLVSNVPLESLSVLRDNTHLILGRLGPEMDPPYLAHRALLPNSDDATDYIVDIISSEFRSLLENYDVGCKSNLDSIRLWLSEYNPSGKFTIQPHRTSNEIDLATIIDFLSKDFKNTCKENSINEKSYKNFTRFFCINDQDSHELDCKFAMLTSLKYRYGWPTICQF